MIASTPEMGTDLPLLATPAQVEAERTLLRLLQDPELKHVRAAVRAEVAATPRGRSEAGAASLDAAIGQWTNSLLMAEISIHQPRPAIVWGTDNTPRTWLGHTLPGIGTFSDNPDAIYRLAIVDGARRYEVVGQFDMARRPAQVTLELHKGAKVTPPPLDAKSDLTPLASINDRHLDVAPDGSFRFTIGPQVESPVHMLSQPGQLTLGFRDMLSDWSQRPCRLGLRELDPAPPRTFGDQDILDAARRDLPPYIRFWSGFAETWMGGLRGNRLAPVQARNGDLAGFMAAFSFDLTAEEAIVVTMDPGEAAYTGFHVISPWMLGSDATRHQNCQNRSQSAANPDGTFTYVVTERDPGFANWLSTCGFREGIGQMRWQAVPADAAMDAGALVRDFRVVNVSDLAGLEGLPRVSPEERRLQMAARRESYHNRVR